MTQNQNETNQACAFSEQLMGYLYNDLGSAETRAFEEHLKGCRLCRQDLEDFRFVRGALSAWQVEESPHFVLQVKPSFWQTLRQLFVAAPVWGKLAFGAVVVMFLVALFNVQIEFDRASGFRFQAGLLPARQGEPVTPVSPPIDRQTVAAVVDELMLKAEERRQTELAAKFEELAKQLRSEQTTTLTSFSEKLTAQQKLQLAALLRELEGRRYGALTFADLFFSGSGSERQ
jgi:hypothetical protein